VQVMDELVTAAEAMDADPAVRVIIVTGDGPKAFAAGADIKEMSMLTYSEVCQPGPATERLKIDALCAPPVLPVSCVTLLCASSTQTRVPDLAAGCLVGRPSISSLGGAWLGWRTCASQPLRRLRATRWGAAASWPCWRTSCSLLTRRSSGRRGWSPVWPCGKERCFLDLTGVHICSIAARGCG